MADLNSEASAIRDRKADISNERIVLEYVRGDTYQGPCTSCAVSKTRTDRTTHGGGTTMLPYVGSGDYCFANSLHMSLLGSGAPTESLPSTGFLECLTTLLFGYTYLKEAELFFFSGPNPDLGLTRALATLGWECQLERGGGEGEALARLRAAVQHGPVLIGPLNMGYLTTIPIIRIWAARITTLWC
jgi:hypothetical protein